MSKSWRKVGPIKLRSVLETAERVISINNQNEDNLVLNDLYKIIHPYVGQCDNQHDDWRLFEEEINKNLKNY